MKGQRVLQIRTIDELIHREVMLLRSAVNHNIAQRGYITLILKILLFFMIKTPDKAVGSVGRYYNQVH